MIPAEEGYFFPAEWHPHRATWISWPHNSNTWPQGLTEVRKCVISLIDIISRGEMVCIQVQNQSMQSQVEKLLLEASLDLQKIRFYKHPTNDAWCRDHGPAFLINSTTRKKLIIDWEYNAWGGKYPPFDDDNAVPQRIAGALGLPVLRPGLVMEGGSVDFNGAGTVITTTSCLLNKNRNPQFSQQQIQAKLCQYYGLQQVIWLHQGIAGDDTDGHIDDICRFVKEDTVVTVMEEDHQELNYKPLLENYKLLKTTRLWDGRSLNVVGIPMPKPQYWERQRLPASYANFYICNAAVIVPIFKDPHDLLAIKTLQDIFTDRPVVGVDSRALVVGLGSFHCLTQQEPDI